MDAGEGHRRDIRDLVRDCAEARERYSVATKEIHRLRSYVADLAAALVTSTKAMTVAQGEVAEARAQVKDLEDDLASMRREFATLGAATTTLRVALTS